MDSEDPGLAWQMHSVLFSCFVMMRLEDFFRKSENQSKYGTLFSRAKNKAVQLFQQPNHGQAFCYYSFKVP